MDKAILDEVEKLASLNYSPKEVAFVVGISEEEMSDKMSDKDSDLFKSFWKGFYTTDIKVRSSIFKLAASGSPPAQALAIKLQEQNLNKMKFNDE